jgi:hypothetical protein
VRCKRTHRLLSRFPANCDVAAAASSQFLVVGLVLVQEPAGGSEEPAVCATAGKGDLLRKCEGNGVYAVGGVRRLLRTAVTL